ncbi:hypothetical protein GGI26_001272 [Coemansia sp. RSA 1358]|uniref:Arrestin-like N-terminal domain-containing protein n=1 Tax=Coemansia umbellata TaxID=1424467 RepID=A0ABQ8PTD6_9FUNG|nr:hypothetical protein BX070DRAFT_97940 [Coemansia spiralis]KAJ1994983.1 hypothetical protein EDC05_001359 [Coemansia umbellata]KAJ2624579.1 hypothetical protein GGI26_001272 [Coemansia sp. RSA 1358]
MKPTAIKIVLDQPTLHILGEQQPLSTAPSQLLLTGHVELYLHTATKVRALELSFVGEQTISFVSRKSSIRGLPAAGELVVCSKTLADIIHDPPLIETTGAGNKPGIKYAAGTHLLRFQFVLPSDLPTSTLLVFGHTRYFVRARLVQSGLRSNCSAEALVAVVRCPGEGSEWSFCAFDALGTGTQWDDRVLVTLSGQTCALGAGTIATLRVEISTMQKHFKLLAIDAVLQEAQCVLSNAIANGERLSSNQQIHKETRVVAHKRLAFEQGGAELGEHDEFGVVLQLPSAFEGIQYSLQSHAVTVTHRLVVTALVKSPEGPVVEITLPSRVWILPQAAVDGEGATDLPQYERANNDRLVETSAIPVVETSTMAGREAELASDLPPYSLPVCLSCGKEDISVLECQRAIFHHSRMPEDAEIEDLCATGIGVQ